MVSRVAGGLRLAAALLLGATLLAGCGRKGPLEPPLSPAEIAAQQKAAEKARAEGRPVPVAGADEDSDGGGLFAPPAARPAAERTRGYTVPKEPFILDPLL